MTDFEIEFETMQQQGWRRVPFSDVLTNSSQFMDQLQKEFTSAPLKPSPRKYAGKYVEGSKEVEIMFRNSVSRLEKKHSDGILDAKYYVNDIDNTNIVIQLKTIGRILDDFKRMEDINLNNLFQHANEFGAAIIREVNRINYMPLRPAVIQTIIEDGRNDINFYHRKVDEAKYRKFKMYLNNYLTENLFDKNTVLTFEDIFINEKAKLKCIDLLEKLEITINNTPNRLTKGKAGNVGAVITVLRVTPNMFKESFTEQQLLQAFNQKLNTNYRRYDKNGVNYKMIISEAEKFIKTMKS